MFSSTVFAFLILSPLVLVVLSAEPAEQPPSSNIIVQGSVFCDVCCDNTFSRHSYFLSGVDVHVQCKFKATSPRTTEQISFSVNRTTDKFGVYKLEIPSVDGVDCVEEPTIQSFCQVNLIQSTTQACNVPSLKSTSNEITIKSKQYNQCIYSLDALSYRPLEKNTTMCRDTALELELESSDSFNSSKFFLPFFPPFRFLWPPFPQLPPLPQLPPFGQFPIPIPSTPTFRFTFSFPPSPPPPNSPPNPPPQTPPPFNPFDPRTWFPFIPSPPPPPPANTNSQHP